jgi:hypothetical protein
MRTNEAQHHDLFDPPVSIARAKLFEEAASKRGGICPCCDRFTKIYRRKYQSNQAQGLIWLYSEELHHRVDADGYIFVRENAPKGIFLTSGTVSINAYWGLAEDKPNIDDPSKRTTGYWRLTARGRAFVEGRVLIESHVITYNAQVLERDDTEMIDISTGLGRPFHYQELMRGTP